MMKRILSIFSFLLLLLINQGIMAETFTTVPTNKDAAITESKDSQHSLQEHIRQFKLNKDQSVASFSSSRGQEISGNCERSLKTLTRQFEILIQKGQATLIKTSEIVSDTHTLICSSLRIRSGHWVYVLRKIII